MKLVPFALLILSLSCSKKFGDLGGNEVLEGQAFIFDKYTAFPDSIKFAAKTVYLRYAGQTNAYIMSVKTDAKGHFSFPNLTSSKKYEVYAEDSINSIPFAGVTTISSFPANVSLLLTPDLTKINVAIVTVLDENNSTPVNGAKVHRFINKSFFDAAYLPGAIDDSVATRGIVYYYNTPPGKYYLYGSVDFNGTLLTGKSEIDIGARGAYTDSIYIK